jgi:pimeloyl-ACP methyl ester carboxylesterase
VTLFLSFRTSPVGGSVLDAPQVLEAHDFSDPVSALPVGLSPERIAGREVVFVTHGFNVSFQDGVRALVRLERALALPQSFVVIGVLWPGDFWVPVINYPAEAEDAVRCGAALAAFANEHLGEATEMSFVSHSLGGRLVLEAVKRLARRAREVCLMAAAVDDNCLSTRQYQAALANAQRISVLASRGDRVLSAAYPLGDFFSDLFYDDDSLARKALGYHGPHPRPAVVLHAQIRGRDYGHGDYLPASARVDPQHGPWEKPAKFIAETLLGQPHAWP